MALSRLFLLPDDRVSLKLRHVWDETCPGCGGRMRQVALVLAASGDVSSWLDDERASQSGVVLLGARARGDPRGSANV